MEETKKSSVSVIVSIDGTLKAFEVPAGTTFQELPRYLENDINFNTSYIKVDESEVIRKGQSMALVDCLDADVTDCSVVFFVVGAKDAKADAENKDAAEKVAESEPASETASVESNVDDAESDTHTEDEEAGDGEEDESKEDESEEDESKEDESEEGDSEEDESEEDESEEDESEEDESEEDESESAEPVQAPQEVVQGHASFFRLNDQPFQIKLNLNGGMTQTCISLTPGQTLRDIVNNPKVASDLGLARAAMGSCDVTLKRTNGSSCTAQKVRPGEFSEIVISQGDVIFFQQRTSGTEG